MMPTQEVLDNEAAEVSDDGDLTDLLGELRVLLPTAQLLSAFLITVPFTPGFSAIAYTEKWVFLTTFVLAVVSLILLSAPAVQHRLIRPLLDRPRFKSFASRQILAGAVTLASALVSGAQLVLSTIFGHVVGSLAAALVALVIFTLWWWLPRRWKRAGKL
ncbi:DUF6328 family protein [Acidovorax sp. HMWF018]|jgi:hypothetical protein|uniref:DUF6328 family protein n=1 Tax=Acidovorax sp. HMWF018 TaxID=2056855 RepID=UPI001E3C3594|nr:DUF6328 family protein [Acidovorax sp. HMWF018]